MLIYRNSLSYNELIYTVMSNKNIIFDKKPKAKTLTFYTGD